MIGVVSLCLTIAIACSCRRRGRNAGQDEEEGRSDRASLQTTNSVICGNGDVIGEDKITKPYDQAGRSGVDNGDKYNANLYKSIPAATAKKV